jgi:hypothetical protein
MDLRYVFREEHEDKRSKQVIDTLYISTCRMMKSPYIEHTGKHLLYPAVLKELYPRACARHIHFDLMQHFQLRFVAVRLIKILGDTMKVFSAFPLECCCPPSTSSGKVSKQQTPRIGPYVSGNAFPRELSQRFDVHVSP